MVDSQPNLPTAIPSSYRSDVNISDPSYFVEQSAPPEEVMADLLFEDIAGQEVISIIRHDLVNGQNSIFRPIKNLSSLAVKYGPQTLVPLQKASDTYFKNFPIKFEQILLQSYDSGTGANGEEVYLEETASGGLLVINVADVPSDQQVEVQLLSSGTVLNDTIYTG